MHLSARDVQKVLREVDNTTLEKALKGADFPVRSKILTLMSERAAEKLREEIERLGEIETKEICEAQDEVLKIMTVLKEKGEIEMTNVHSE